MQQREQWGSHIGFILASIGSAVVFIVIVTWFMDRKKILEQVNLNSRIKMPSSVITLVKFIFPTLVIASILFTVFSV